MSKTQCRLFSAPQSQFRHLTNPHTCATVSHMPTTDALSALSAYSAVGPSPYLSATCAPCPYSIRVPTHRRRGCPVNVQQVSSKCRTRSPSPAMKITKTSTDWTHLENFPSSSARHCLTSPSPARSPEASQCQNAIALSNSPSPLTAVNWGEGDLLPRKHTP